MRRVFLSLTLICASPAVAQPAPADVKAKPASNAGERVICRKIEEVGTRLGGKRVCMTASQWAEQQRVEREAVEEAQRKSYQPR